MNPSDFALDRILGEMNVGSVDTVEDARELFDAISEILRWTGRLVAGELADGYR